MEKKPAKKQLPVKRRFGGKGKNVDRWIVVGIIVALLAIGLSLWGPLSKYRPDVEKRTGEQAKKKQPSDKAVKKTHGSQNC
jgi:hypothetical protein